MDARTYIEMKQRQRKAAEKANERRLTSTISEPKPIKQTSTTSDKYRGVVNN